MARAAGEACGDARIDCTPSPDGGFGPSDQMPFYAAGVPVVHFFTGSHADYHKPSDAADRINAAGAAQMAPRSPRSPPASPRATRRSRSSA